MQAAQHARRREDEQHAGHAPPRNAEVLERRGLDRGDRPERADDRRRGRQQHHEKHDADAEREPEAVDARGVRAGPVAGSEAARDGRGRGVGEEHEEADRRLEHRRGDAEPGEGIRPQMADHGRVGEHEQRLGDEGSERGHGEAQDVAVDRAQAEGHASTLRAARP